MDAFWIEVSTTSTLAQDNADHFELLEAPDTVAEDESHIQHGGRADEFWAEVNIEIAGARAQTTSGSSPMDSHAGVEVSSEDEGILTSRSKKIISSTSTKAPAQRPLFVSRAEPSPRGRSTACVTATAVIVVPRQDLQAVSRRTYHSSHTLQQKKSHKASKQLWPVLLVHMTKALLIF